MNKQELLFQITGQDLLEDVDPKELGKEARLSWIKRILLAAIWPLIKPYIQKKIGQKIADLLGLIFEEI